MMTMISWSFLHYWLYAAFPHCHGLREYLLENFPREDKEQGTVPVCRTVIADGQEITILLYRYHVEYRMGERALYRPFLPYHVVEELDNDTFFLLLPMVDMAERGYSYSNVMPDLIRRLSETALPQEHVEEVAFGLSIGLAEADGAEDEPSWVIWVETEDDLYGAEWWQDAGELHLFQQDTDDDVLPDDYISVPEGEDVYLWAKSALAKWISSGLQGKK